MNKTLKQFLPYILLVAGIIGLIASVVLTLEKFQLARNTAYQPSCNLNPLISCSSVMNSPQAEVFRVPNSLIGIVAFTIVTTVGVSLMAGAVYKRWFWLGLQAGTLFGAGFVHWLIFQSVYRIGALCPYCMVVWSVTIPMFWYVTLYNLREKHFALPRQFGPAAAFAQRHHGNILLVWFLVVASLILYRFWYYWSTLL